MNSLNLKHQPQRPNSKQALEAWVYAFLRNENHNRTVSCKEALQPGIDASFPFLRNTGSEKLEQIRIDISTPAFLLHVTYLDELTVKMRTKTVIQTIANLEAVSLWLQRKSYLTDNPEYTPPYLLMLSAHGEGGIERLSPYQSADNQLFSMHHGAYYRGEESGIYHGKEMLTQRCSTT